MTAPGERGGPSTVDAPQSLWDVDGNLIAYRGHDWTRMQILELLVDEMGDDWVLEAGLVYLTAADEWRYSHRIARQLADGFAAGYYRPADLTVYHEAEGDFGSAGWWPCDAADEGAVAYTKTGLE